MSRPPRGHYTPAQLAEYLAIPEHTLRAWRHRGGGPPFYKFGPQVRYDVGDVDKWRASCRVTD